MKKNIMLLILTVSLLFVSIRINDVYALDDPTDMKIAYDEIVALRPAWGLIFPIEAFDTDVWNKYKVLVLDIPGTFPNNLATIKEDDNSPNDYNETVGEYRYIGMNPDGYLVNNPKYPDDNSGNELINSYDWQENPDFKTNIQQYITHEEDKSFYESEIFNFLEGEYGTRFDDQEDPKRWLDNAIVIVPVSSTGNGVIKFMHKWDSDGNGNAEDWYITVNLRSKNEAMAPSARILNKVSEDYFYQSIEFNRLDINELIDIRSGQKGHEEFVSDVAIPSGEPLYISAQVDEYLSDVTYVRLYGSENYAVYVSRNYYLEKWNPTAVKIDANGDGDYTDPGDSITGKWVKKGPYLVSEAYSIYRSYECYHVSNLQMYKLDNIKVSNDCLEDKIVTLKSSVQGPSIFLEKHGEDDIIEPTTEAVTYVQLPDKTLRSRNHYPSVPQADFESYAEQAIPEFQVRNDSLVINGLTIMDGSWTSTNGPKAIPIPRAPLNPQGDLYKEDLVIPTDTANGLYTTSGKVAYKKIYPLNEEETLSHNLSGFEDVYVHTPVVCNPELKAISRETQLVTKDPNELQLVIEETLHIDYPTSGQHRSAMGYGDRDYKDYTKLKQVKFPVDVYVGTDYDGLYLPKDTWGNFNSLENEFFIPSWAEEGQGHILFRSLATNIKDDDEKEYEYKANINPINYKAVEAMAVNVTGKATNLKITNCPDDYWQHNFAKDTDFYIGLKPDNKDKLDDEGIVITQENILPLLPGKSYTDKEGNVKKNGGVMLGYPVEFSITTNGDLYDDNDFVYIKPTFSYVPAIKGVPDMSLRQAVDLYVSTYQGLESFETDLVLTSDDRVHIGDVAEKASSVSKEDKEKSIQQWNGSYFLPNMTYALAAGTDISKLTKVDLHQKPFLHDGFIIVNFEILVYDQVTGLTKAIRADTSSLKNYLNTQAQHIVYGIGWQEEAYELNQLGLPLEYGDIIFYDTDRRASETYY